MKIVGVLIVAAVFGACSNNHTNRHGATTNSDGNMSIASRKYSLPVGHSGIQAHEVALLPPNPHGRPLLLLLHGRGNRPSAWTKPPMLSILKKMGDRAPVVVAVDGGDHSYFHDRREADWGSYILDGVIPDAISRFGIDKNRIAVGGHSMGGFGAFATATSGRTFCAVGAHEPAIWQYPEEVAAGAFDDAEDFNRNNLIRYAQTERDPFGDAKIWIDYGRSDPFIPGVEAFIAALRLNGQAVDVRTWPGEHGMKYVRRHLKTYMNFYANAFDTCA